MKDILPPTPALGMNPGPGQTTELIVKRALRAAKVGLWDWDIKEQRVSYSAEWKQQLGYEEHEISDSFQEWEDRMHPDDRSKVRELLAEFIARPRTHYEAEFRMRHRNGTWRWILAQAELFLDEDGRPTRMVGCHIDVTERKHAESELIHANRALRIRSESNQALVRITNEATLLAEICRIAVRIGGYEVAWVGLSDPGIPGNIRPIAHATAPGTSWEMGPLPWSDAEPDGGAVGTAIRTGRPCIGRSTPLGAAPTGQTITPVPHGCACGVALPIARQGEILGALCIFAGEVDAFDAVEVKTLMDLAGDLAFGLHVLRTRIQRDLASDALRESQRKLAVAERIAPVVPDAAIQGSLARILRQEATLISLIKREQVGPADLVRSLQHLVEACARTLEVCQVSIWRFQADRTGLICVDLFRLSENRHYSGQILAAEDYPSYFEALRECDVIAADDAREDERTREFNDSYLHPAGITSMLDVPVRLNGALDGVLCHEHTGPRRHWTADEKTFAIAVANLVAVKLEEWERRQAEDALRKSEVDLELALEAGGLGEWKWNIRTGEIFWSERCKALYGLSPDATVTYELFLSLVHPDDRERMDGVLREAVETRTSFEIEKRVIWPDGSLHWNVSRARVFTDAEGNAVQMAGVSMDVTTRKLAEDALRESEQRFRQLTESIDEVFWLMDVSEKRIIYVSPAYERIWGRSCESLYSSAHSWFEAIHPEDREHVTRVTQTLQEAGLHDLKYRIVRPDGALRWIHDRAFPILDTRGRVYRIAGVGEDITERRELEEQLRQAQKMEAIGRLAGGIAHDFNNILAIIQMQSSLLLTDSTLSTDTTEGVRGIMAAAERAASLTKQLLTFSRRDVKRPNPLDLGETVTSTTGLLRRILGEDIVLDCQIADSLPRVNADRGMMEQVLMNLALNARDAMPGGGRLTIHLNAVPVGEYEVSRHAGAQVGKYLKLEVSDTGCGIPRENMARVFEPFFTTKGPGKGTGLGLATVFGIVQQHHGWIEVESEVDQGSVFRVFLPALLNSASRSADTVDEGRMRGGRERILVVEDDAGIRKLATVVLERFGYTVIAADSGPAALRLWESMGDSVDLLLTDLVMPGGMTGRELATRLLAERPNLKCVFTSGYSDDVVYRHLPLDSRRTFLQKPYTAPDLLGIVRRCLDERGEGPVNEPPRERLVPGPVHRANQETQTQ